MFLIQHQFLLRISPKLALDLMEATEQSRKACLSRNGIFFLYVESTMEIFRMCCPHGDVSPCSGPTENLLCETCKLIDLSWIAWDCSFVIKVFALQAQRPEFNPQDPQKKLGIALWMWRQADLQELLTSQYRPVGESQILKREPSVSKDKVGGSQEMVPGVDLWPSQAPVHLTHTHLPFFPHS